jgi:hypothetical protein
MAQFESQKKSARNLVLSANKQVAYGGVLPDLSLTHRQRFDGSAVLDMSPTRRSDAEYSGKGTEFATDGQTTGFDTKFNFKAEADAWLAGYGFAFAMGKETVTGVAAPYTHAFVFDESTSQACGTTLYLEDTNDVKNKVQDMAVSELTLQIGARGACELDLSFAGTGRLTPGAMVAPLPALTASRYLLGSDCAFSLGPTGAPLLMAARHLSTTIKIGTGVVSHVASGSGLYGAFMRTERRTISQTTTIAAKDTDDIWTLLANDTIVEAKWAINSGAAAQLMIDIPACKMKATKLGVDGNMIIWSIETDQTTMFSALGVAPMTVQVMNSVAAYLIGV